MALVKPSIEVAWGGTARRPPQGGSADCAVTSSWRVVSGRSPDLKGSLGMSASLAR